VQRRCARGAEDSVILEGASHHGPQTQE